MAGRVFCAKIIKSQADAHNQVIHGKGGQQEPPFFLRDGAGGTCTIALIKECAVMLALTRRIGEEIVIGDPAEPLGVIRVVEIHGDKVRLSFDFPRKVKINRRELAEEKLRHQRNQTPDPGNGG